MFHTVVASSPMRQGRLASYPMPPSMARNLSMCPPPMHHHPPHHQHSHHQLHPAHYQMVHPPNIYQHYHQQTSLHRLPIPPPPYHTIGHHSHPIPAPPPPTQPPPQPVPAPTYPEAIVEAPPGFTPLQVLCAVCCLRSHDKQETTFIHPMTKAASGESDVVKTPPQHSYREEEPLARPTTLSATLEPRRMNKKKSLSGNSLRSPAAKRSDQSPVAMKGWLYKQGSDGLMLWKKRWFVLSDFCLFYYKGPEEDKILGSILLPSYKISPCTTDDRIYRKFAFKAEHHNMRTYYFASETKKEMQQWMNAMSLASILQNNGSFGNRDEIMERTGHELTSVGSMTGNEDEDSGFTSYHSRRPPNSPHQDGNSTLTDSYTSNDIYRGSGRADDSMHDSASESSYPEGYLGSADKYPNPNYGGSHQLHPQHHSNVFQQQAGTPGQHGSKQHLYANAPPKPKRMGGPADVYMLNRESEGMNPRQLTSQGQYMDYVEREKSSHHPQFAALRATREQPVMPKHRLEDYQGPISSQRRTPDPYARTTVVQGFEYAPGGRHERNGHYTDDYAASIAAVAGQMHTQGHEEYSRRQPIEYQPLRVAKGPAGVLRPHSAEFLEYDVYADKGRRDVPPGHQRRVRNVEVLQGRPKSSIERYALPDYIANEGEMGDYRTQLLGERLQAAGKENQHLQELINERKSGAWTPRDAPPTKVSAPHNMSFDSYLTREVPYGSQQNVAPQQSQSEPRPHHMPSSHLEKLSTTPSASMLALDAASRNSGMASLARAEGSRTLPRDRSFMRSASARLPTATSMNSVAQQRYSNGGREDTRWKAQQREESMKRLLEWKQRMLQSPLTKKYPSKGGVAGLLLHPHSVPSSAATTPSSGMARLINTDQQQKIAAQHRPTTPHRATTPSQQQQQQQQQLSSAQVDGMTVNPNRLPSSEQYRQQVLKELVNHESGLKIQPAGPLRADEIPERGERNSLHWRDKELIKSRENQDAIIGKMERGVKTSRTPSRSPNRTQEHRRSTSSLNRYYNSYSSDDEEVSLHELRRARLEAQASRARRNSSDKQLGNGRRTGTPPITSSTPSDGYKSKAPDYVNINAFSNAQSEKNFESSIAFNENENPAGHEYANLPFSPKNQKFDNIHNDENHPSECLSPEKSTSRRRHCSEPNRSQRCNRYYDDEYDDDGGDDMDDDTDNMHSESNPAKASKCLDKPETAGSKASRKYFQDESTQTCIIFKADTTGLNSSSVARENDAKIYSRGGVDSKKEIYSLHSALNHNQDFLEDQHSVEEVRSQDRFFHSTYMDRYYSEKKSCAESSSSKTWESYPSSAPIVRWQTLPTRSHTKSENISRTENLNTKPLDAFPVPHLAIDGTDLTFSTEIVPTTVEPPEPFRSSCPAEPMKNTWTPCSPPRSLETRCFSGQWASNEECRDGGFDVSNFEVCRNLDELIRQQSNPSRALAESSEKTLCQSGDSSDPYGKQQMQSFSTVSNLAQPLDFRKQKESPPKNIVQDRIRIFESQTDVPTPAATPNTSPSERKTTSKSSSPDGVLDSGHGDEGFRNVGGRDETEPSQQSQSFRRRFHSDTEALMYDSSASESSGEHGNAQASVKGNDTASNEVLSDLRHLADEGKGLASSSRRPCSNLNPVGKLGDPSQLEMRTHFGEDSPKYAKMGSSCMSQLSVSMKDLLTARSETSTNFGAKSSSDVEEYYLPMNRAGMGFFSLGGKMPTTSAFGKLPETEIQPGNAGSQSWMLDDEKHLLEPDEAVYVQMDGPSAFGIQIPRAGSIISPIEESGSDRQEPELDPGSPLKAEPERRSSTSSASIPDGGCAEHKTGTMTFENYGYYEIADDSQPAKDTFKDDSLSSNYEPIYAELKHNAMNRYGAAISSPLLGRFNDAMLNHRETSPSLPQRNSSNLSLLSASKSQLSGSAATQVGETKSSDAENGNLEIQRKSECSVGKMHEPLGQAETGSASDADDEASKDFDMNPRFSLSDSFRPASYYLKVSAAASMAKNSKNQLPQSSEEELESPPPIPLSPPPSLCDSDTLEHMKLNFGKRNNSDSGISSATGCTSAPASRSKQSRSYGQKSGLPLVPKTRSKFQRDSTDQSDASPPTSPLHCKLNYSYYRVYEDERRVTELLVKPVLAESVPPSLSAPSSPTSGTAKPFSFSANSSSDVTRLKLNLNVRKLRIYDEGKAPSNPRHSPFKLKPLITQPLLTGEGRFSSVVRDAETQWSPPVSSASESDPPIQDLSLSASDTVQSVSLETREHPPQIMLEESRDVDHRDSVEGSTKSNRSPNSAPYYYSDLLREDEDCPFGSGDGFSSATSVTSERCHSRSSGISKRRQHQLNNSRSIGWVRRDEVGRKVNNIELAQNRGLRPTRQLSCSTPAVSVEGDRLTVANELSNSIVYLEAKKLAGTEHNTYESDTLKKSAMAHDRTMAASGLDLRNLYPAGIGGEKLAPPSSTSPTTHPISHMQSRRLSRSLEGLLDDPSQEFSRPGRRDNQRNPSGAIELESVFVHGEFHDPVTLRGAPRMGRSIPQGQSTSMASLHRDNFAGVRPAQSLVGLDQVAREAGQRLTSPHASERDTRQNHFLGNGPSSEAYLIDREKLRQWDLMSSAPSAPSSTAQGSDSRGEGYPTEERRLSTNNAGMEGLTNGHFWVRSRDEPGLPSASNHTTEEDPYMTNHNDDKTPYSALHHHFLVKRERSDFDGGGCEVTNDLEPRNAFDEGPSRTANTNAVDQFDNRICLYNDEVQHCIGYSCHAQTEPGLPIDDQRPSMDNCMSPDVIGESESWSGSLRNQKENRSPLRQQALRLPTKKKHRNDVAPVTTGLKTVREDNNVSDSEVQAEMKMQNVKIQKYLSEKEYDDHKVKLSISAGDLLGKTHEELVLLLIQLRRDQAKIEQEMHKYSVDLDTEHKMLLFDTSNRSEHVNKQKQLIKQFEELSKQYDLTKPLINLVDNMVKLGSLYGGSEQMLATQYQLERLPPQDYAPPKKMIEFSRRLQEQRLLQHERAEWDQLAPEQVDLQSKLQELCKLDQALHEESYFVSGLQQDKDMLEKAVESLKVKLDGCRESPVELEKLQKQLRAAEKELSKIRNQLTRGTKKLEETASDNAKIENEILVLRQKMQASIKQGLSSGSLNEASHVKVQLEKELSRISNVMEDLAWKREELSGALEQLKDRNKALLADVRASPTGTAGSAALPGRKNHRSTYLETDLDTMETRDIIESWKRGDGLAPNSGGQRRVPLYVNTYNNNGLETGSLTTSSISSSKEDVNSSLEYVQSEQPESETYKPQDINEADDKMKRFYGILPREKQEIKTVRIVKRESERRNKGRDRDRRKPSYEGDPSLTKVGEDGGVDPAYFDDPELTEEMLQFQRSMSLPRNYGRSLYLLQGPNGGPNAVGIPNELPALQGSQPGTNNLPFNAVNNKNVSYYYRTPSLSNLSSEPNLSAHERLFGTPTNGNPPSPTTTSPTLFTPTFKSEAARKIVAETAHELAINVSNDFSLCSDGVTGSPEKYEAGSLKRRQKRRHYTISSSQPMVLETVSQKMVHARSRDDLDIERCLRSSNTPDVVKSTIKKNEMFDESTIDRELGLPQKILIPERYVEEEGEELSAAEQLHRLQKAESIRKMLSESSTYGDVPQEEAKSATLKKKFEADRKQREHLLALNQIIAKEVMERSKAVAAKAMKNLSKAPSPKKEEVDDEDEDEEDESPEQPLPIIQQRENLLT